MYCVLMPRSLALLYNAPLAVTLLPFCSQIHATQARVLLLAVHVTDNCGLRAHTELTVMCALAHLELDCRPCGAADKVGAEHQSCTKKLEHGRFGPLARPTAFGVGLALPCERSFKQLRRQR
jgi:hypothetical protein